MEDPGTIYSDDEVVNYSEDDEEDEKEIELQKNVMDNECDNFFDDLPDETMKLFETKKSAIDKYMTNKENTKPFDINNIIEKVRSRNKKLFPNVHDNDGKDLTLIENENNAIKEPDELKLKTNMKMKMKKKERAQKCIEEKMAKERNEFHFEDAPTVTSDISFHEMNLSPPLLKAISNMGYVTPTPIQASTIPIALKGRDICGCAATGTGKTAAFMLPIVQRLLFKPISDERFTRALILVPTRELGVQVFEVGRDICQFTSVTISLTVGGLNRNTQTVELLGNPDIIIATPGRLIDHLHNTKHFSLRNIEVLVIDEADRMLDSFFIEQLTEVVKQCSFTTQTMLFSATMTEEVKDLVVVSLKRPVRVFVNNNTDVAQNLSQEFIQLKVDNEENRLAVLAHLLMTNLNDETLVFIRRKSDCHKINIIFGLLGLKCGELHADLNQKKRLEYLKKFKDKEINVLFATDVAARGLDIKGVKAVINYSLPVSYEMYVHRVGRTARAGFSGRSITIAYDSGNDFKMLRKIQKNSFSPLYERIINKNHIMFYITKLKSIELTVKQVLLMEEAEKQYGSTSYAVDQMKKEQLLETKKNTKKTKTMEIIKEEKILSLEQIRERKEKLLKFINGSYKRNKLGKKSKKGKEKKKIQKEKPKKNQKKTVPQTNVQDKKKKNVPQTNVQDKKKKNVPQTNVQDKKKKNGKRKRGQTSMFDKEARAELNFHRKRK